MSPPWVLLYRCVDFIEGRSAGGACNAVAAIGKSRREPSLGAAALKPDLAVVDPPEVTFLSVVQNLPEDLAQGMQGVDSGMIVSTDKGLLVLYAGMYQPGNSVGTRHVGYLVYDASSSSLSTIPQLDWHISLSTMKCLGASAAIMRCRYGVHILAELVTSVDSGLPNANLYLRRSSIPMGHSTGQWASLSSAPQWLPEDRWVRTEVSLPLPTELCGPKCFFHIDMAFAFEGSVCWVDLYTGVLTCDLFAPGGPKFSFVPLPKECCLYTPEETRQTAGTSPKEFCSMGAVSGAIKFVALVGYSRDWQDEEVVLKTWTLSPDFKEWKQDAAVLVRDLWQSESFRKMELPRVVPMNPVLSMNEDEVVYISLNDMEYVDRVDRWKQIVGKDLVLNGHYTLCLDLLQNKVLYSKKDATNDLSLLTPMVLASDISAYLHDGSKIRQRGEEASEAKRTKY